MLRYFTLLPKGLNEGGKQKGKGVAEWLVALCLPPALIKIALPPEGGNMNVEV